MTGPSKSFEPRKRALTPSGGGGRKAMAVRHAARLAIPEGAPVPKPLQFTTKYQLPHFKMTRSRAEKFLAALSENGDIPTSAKQVDGFSGTHRAYKALALKDEGFRKAMDDSLAEFSAKVNAAINEEAIEGVEKFGISQGMAVSLGKVREPRLLALVARKHDASLAAANQSGSNIKIAVSTGDNHQAPPGSFLLWPHETHFLQDDDQKNLVRILRLIQARRGAEESEELDFDMNPSQELLELQAEAENVEFVEDDTAPDDDSNPFGI